MSMTGEKGGQPLRAGLPISDLVAGMYAALGILGALVGRGRTGQGDVVTTNLTAGLVELSQLRIQPLFRHRGGAGPQRQRPSDQRPLRHVQDRGRRHRDCTVRDNDFFRRLMRALGLAAEIDRPEFVNNRTRVQHRALIDGMVSDKLKAHGSAYWIEALNAGGVPCGAGIFRPAGVRGSPDRRPAAGAGIRRSEARPDQGAGPRRAIRRSPGAQAAIGCRRSASTTPRFSARSALPRRSSPRWRHAASSDFVRKGMHTIIAAIARIATPDAAMNRSS